MQCIDQIINPSDCELTSEEFAVFIQLPEWHQAALLNWIDDWRLRYFVVENCGLLDFDPLDLPDDFPVNKCVIKKGLAACLDVDNVAAKELWTLHQKVVMNMTDSMYLDELSKLIFPFQPYEVIARELEDGLFALGFCEKVISIEELHATLLKTDWLGVSAVIAFEIWSAYLRDWKDYIAYLRKKDEARIFSFNQRTVSAAFSGISFESKLVGDTLKSHTEKVEVNKDEVVSKINRRPSTLDKIQERLDIYNQVVKEKGAGTHKNVLLREAAKRAGCGIDSIKRALGEKD